MKDLNTVLPFPVAPKAADKEITKLKDKPLVPPVMERTDKHTYPCGVCGNYHKGK